MDRISQNPPSDLPEMWRTPYNNGLSCFPAKLRSKTPDIPWLRFQTQHAPIEQIIAWAERPSNIAICTGKISGIIVLDLDSAEAVQAAERLGLPHTVSVKTGNGRHIYFKHPGGKIGNRAGIFLGADIRGDGGYVIAPGSIHATGVEYEWINSPDDTEFAECPQWLIEMLNGRKNLASFNRRHAESTFSSAEMAQAYLHTSVQAEIATLTRTPNGGRNDQLNKSTFILAKLAAESGCEWQPIEDQIRRTGYQIGLGTGEINATIRSAREKGFQNASPMCGITLGLKETYAIRSQAEDVPPAFPTLDLAALALVDPQPKQFIIPGLAPAGEVTLFTGQGSAGKSLLSQQLATAVAAGMSTLRLELEQANTIYLTCEDDEDQLHWRQTHICAALNVLMGNLKDKLHLVTLRGALGVELCTFAKGGFFTLARAYHQLVALIEQTGSKLVFLDNLAHLFTGNENDRGDVTRFLNALNRVASHTGAAIVLLGHPNKQHSQGIKLGNQYSGSTAWQNAVRSQITLEYNAGTGLRILMVSKANYGRTDQAIRFFFVNWAFVHVDDAPADIGQAMIQAMRAREDDARFLACLRERNRQKRAVSESKNAPTYAPSEFAKMPEAKGSDKERLVASLDRLWRLGKIERGELWKGDDRKMVTGIREVAQFTVGDVGETRDG